MYPKQVHLNLKKPTPHNVPSQLKYLKNSTITKNVQILLFKNMLTATLTNMIWTRNSSQRILVSNFNTAITFTRK